jgi:tape measure domain-containing protein
MAKGIGTVFVELSLDDKIYKQKLSETLTSATATAKGIEASWKALGVKNDATFDAQRRSYENALTLIRNSTDKTKADIIRAEQAAATKIAQINEQQFGKQTSMIEGLKKNWIAASAAIYAAWRITSRGIAEAGEVFGAGMQAQQMKKAFGEIAGGAALAEKELAFLRTTADKLGQNFWDLQGSYKSLLAASKGTVLAGQQTRDIFEAVTKASTTLGLSSEKTKLTLYAVEQMMSKGKLSAEELRRQMGDNLPGAFSLAARAMGMTTLEFDKALKSGDIMADEFLPKFAKVLNETYSGEVSASVAATNKWNEALIDLKVNIAESGFLETATKVIKDFTATVKDESFQNALSVFANDMMSIAGSIASMAKYAGLRSVSGTYQQGVELSQKGALDLDAFQASSFTDRQRMVDAAIKAEGNASFTEHEKRRLGMRSYTPAAPVAMPTGLAEAASEKKLKLSDNWTVDAWKKEDKYNEASRQSAEAIIWKTRVTQGLIQEQDILIDSNQQMIETYSMSELKLQQIADEYIDANQVAIKFKNSFDGITMAIEASSGALADFVVTGKMDFKSFADSIIRDFVRIQIQQSLTYAATGGKQGSSGWIGGALSLVGSLFNAKGNAFDAGEVTPFARGGIFDRPTIFPMARGMGLMGEAGPEAVMPLTRGSDGKLGVKAKGGDGNGEGGTNIFIQAVDAKSFEDLCKRNPAAITGPILQSLRDNKTRTEFRRMVN